MTQHQQELDRALGVTSEDRQVNKTGTLTITQSRRARRHFVFIAFFITVFFGGSLAILLFDSQARWSWIGLVLLGVAILSGWLLLRYIQNIYRVNPGFPVRVVEGVLSRYGWTSSRSHHFTIRVGDVLFDVYQRLWLVVCPGAVYRGYYIIPGEQIPPYLVALEETDGRNEPVV